MKHGCLVRETEEMSAAHSVLVVLAVVVVVVVVIFVTSTRDPAPSATGRYN
jgi:hypothetical protein